MANVLEVQRKILSDASARKAFAADPRGYLKQEGVAVPEGVQLPPSIPLDAFEAQIAEVESRLAKRGVNLKQFDPSQLKKAGLIDTEELAGLEKRPAPEQNILP